MLSFRIFQLGLHLDLKAWEAYEENEKTFRKALITAFLMRLGIKCLKKVLKIGRHIKWIYYYRLIFNPTNLFITLYYPNDLSVEKIFDLTFYKFNGCDRLGWMWEITHGTQLTGKLFICLYIKIYLYTYVCTKILSKHNRPTMNIF